MAIISIAIHCSPYAHQSALTAYRYIEAALHLGHQIDAVFFYGDGSLHASQALSIPSDELNTQTMLAQLNATHKTPLLVCVTAAEKRGINTENCHASYTIAGLAEFASIVSKSDRFMQFH